MKRILLIFFVFSALLTHAQSKKISELPDATSLTGTEIVPVLQGGTNKKTTAQNIANLTPTGVTSVAITLPSLFSIVGSPITSSGTFAITYSGTPLPVANGGNGTSTPALTAGSNVSISGTWPNYTINASGAALTDGNGTTASGSSVNLGGPLTQPTSITGTSTNTFSNSITNGGFSTTTMALTNNGGDASDGSSSIGSDANFKVTNVNTRSGSYTSSFIVGRDDANSGGALRFNVFETSNPTTVYGKLAVRNSLINQVVRSGSTSTTLNHNTGGWSYTSDLGNVFSLSNSVAQFHRGILRFPEYATASLPSAALSVNGFVFDTDTDELKFSDGSAWNAVGAGGGSVLAGNGLYDDAGTFKWGGNPLVEATTIDADGNSIDFLNVDIFGLSANEVYISSGSVFDMTSVSDWTVTSGAGIDFEAAGRIQFLSTASDYRFTGVIQNDDLDSLMVMNGDGNVYWRDASSIIPGDTDYENALTESAGVVKWNGPLTEDVSIDGNAMDIHFGLAGGGNNVDEFTIVANTIDLTASTLNVSELSVNNAYTLPTADGTNGQQLTTNGSGVLSWAAAGSGGGVTSVGLATGTSGTDVNVSGSPITSSGNITLNIPDASATARGLVTTGTQTFAGNKTFSGSNAYGTPASITLTNATGLPVSTGISGLGTGVATWLATPSSSNLASAVTGETGSGALVFDTSPTLTTPNLGTPSAVTLTNGTGLPVSTGISGLGTGVATFLATPSSSNLATAVTGETGSGALVFDTSPALTGTPTAPTATGSTNSTQIATTAFVKASSPKVYSFAFTDQNTVITAGTAKLTFYMPYAMTVTNVYCYLKTAQTGGSLFTIDINEAGTTIMSATKVTLDNNENHSSTAATQPVISDTSLAAFAAMTVDVDVVGTGSPVGGGCDIIGY